MAIKYNCALRMSEWPDDTFVYYDGPIELLNPNDYEKAWNYFYSSNSYGRHPFIFSLQYLRSNDWQTIGNYRFFKEGSGFTKGEVLEVF